jgi:hypothetical protein
MPLPGRSLVPLESTVGDRGCGRSIEHEIAWLAAESKSPARFPTRAHFLIFYFTIDDSMSGGNYKIAAWVFFAHRRNCSVGSISTVSSVRIAGEPMSQI